MDRLPELLHSTFGFANFRANQEAVCRAATAGRDVLLVMPTGAGKSLCYQLPVLARGGTGLVVSPLIALMDDQASKLAGLGLRVARIHSALSREESRQACRDYLDGKLNFLFIAPERMRVPGFPEMLAKRKPSLIAIDEAHCISAWGHDFRPDYRSLGEHLPALRPAPILALTATATPTVQKDILAQLRLEDPALFIHGFRRDNLAIEVVELSKPRRAEFTTTFLSEKSRRPAIVYAPSRRVAEELASELGRRFPAAAYHAGLAPALRERVQRDFQAGKLEVVVATIAFGMGIDKADVRTVVHVALPASVEAYYQEIGRAGRDGLPASTVLLYSFVDRKIHDTFLERDYPMVGDLLRVGKVLTDEFLMPEYLASRLRMDLELVAKALDKLASQGAAQFDMGGLVRATAITHSEGAPWQSGYAQQVEFRRSQIERMMQFAESQQCRMSALIRHFGDTADAHRACGRCDFCSPSTMSAQTFAEPNAAEEKSLRSILRALEGGASKSIGRLFTDLALTKNRDEFEALLEGLARAGLVAIRSESFVNPEGNLIGYKKASLTHEGAAAAAASGAVGVLLRAIAAPSASKSGKRTGLRKSADGFAKKGKAEPLTFERDAAVKEKRPREFRRERAAAAAEEPDALSADQQELELRLRDWRKTQSLTLGLPPFFVLGTSTLRSIVLSRPRSLAQLQRISGIGPEKLDRFGAAILHVCNA